jgi:hypothetical protein
MSEPEFNTEYFKYFQLYLKYKIKSENKIAATKLTSKELNDYWTKMKETTVGETGLKVTDKDNKIWCISDIPVKDKTIAKPRPIEIINYICASIKMWVDNHYKEISNTIKERIDKIRDENLELIKSKKINSIKELNDKMKSSDNSLIYSSDFKDSKCNINSLNEESKTMETSDEPESFESDLNFLDKQIDLQKGPIDLAVKATNAGLRLIDINDISLITTRLVKTVNSTLLEEDFSNLKDFVKNSNKVYEKLKTIVKGYEEYVKTANDKSLDELEKSLQNKRKANEGQGLKQLNEAFTTALNQSNTK